MRTVFGPVGMSRQNALGRGILGVVGTGRCWTRSGGQRREGSISCAREGSRARRKLGPSWNEGGVHFGECAAHRCHDDGASGGRPGSPREFRVYYRPASAWIVPAAPSVPNPEAIACPWFWPWRLDRHCSRRSLEPACRRRDGRGRIGGQASVFPVARWLSLALVVPWLAMPAAL